MRIGLIGFGSIGKRHYDNLLHEKQDVTVLSKREDTGLGKARAGTWKAFASSAPYDAIFVTNETAKHVSIIKRALSLHPRALCVEKPLSHTPRGLEGLRSLLEKERVSLFVAYCFQFSEPFLFMKDRIASGALGKVYSLRVSVGQDLKEWRTRDYTAVYSAKKSEGGGVMLDLIHDINYPAWLLGEKLIPRSAVVRKISPLAIDTEDIAESLLLSEKSGTIVSVHQDYLREKGRRSLELIGELGSLTWDSDTNIVIVEGKTKREQKEFPIDRNGMYLKETEWFLDQVEKGTYFSNIDEAIRDVQTVEILKRYGKK